MVNFEPPSLKHMSVNDNTFLRGLRRVRDTKINTDWLKPSVPWSDTQGGDTGETWPALCPHRRTFICYILSQFFNIIIFCNIVNVSTPHLEDHVQVCFYMFLK